MQSTIWDGALYPGHEGSKACQGRQERCAVILATCNKSLSLVLRLYLEEVQNISKHMGVRLQD